MEIPSQHLGIFFPTTPSTFSNILSILKTVLSFSAGRRNIYAMIFVVQPARVAGQCLVIYTFCCFTTDRTFIFWGVHVGGHSRVLDYVCKSEGLFWRSKLLSWRLHRNTQAFFPTTPSKFSNILSILKTVIFFSAGRRNIYAMMFV